MWKSIAVFVLTLGISSAAQAEQFVTHPFTSSVPHGAIQRVVIDVPECHLTIRNGEGSSLSLTGTVRRGFRGSDRAKKQQIVDDSAIEIYASKGEAIVRRVFGPNASGWVAQNHNMKFEVRLEVPEGMNLVIQTRYGDIMLHGSFGNIDTDLRSGALSLRTPRSAVRELNASCRVGQLRTNFGDETVKRAGVLPGTTEFFNAGGQSVVNLHAVAGQVDVTLTP